MCVCGGHHITHHINQPLQTYRKFTCAYNEYATQDCRLDGQAITSNTVCKSDSVGRAYANH